MSNRYEFDYTTDEKNTLAAMRATPPYPSVRGATASKALRLLHCVLLVWGCVAIGYGVTDLLDGPATLMHWSTVVGLCLAYIAIFGSIFITLPVMVRTILATRVNTAQISMMVDEAGVVTQNTYFKSIIKWAGIEGITRTKVGFVLWLGGNRPSVPFTAFESVEQIDAFEADVKTWLEALR